MEELTGRALVNAQRRAKRSQTGVLERRIKALRTRHHGLKRNCFYCGGGETWLEVTVDDRLFVHCTKNGCPGATIPQRHVQ